MLATIVYSFSPIPEAMFSVVSVAIAWILAPRLRWYWLAVALAFAVAIVLHWLAWDHGRTFDHWKAFTNVISPSRWGNDFSSQLAMLFVYGILPLGLGMASALLSKNRFRVSAEFGPNCVCCKYDLRGNADGVSCPECGQVISDSKRRWLETNTGMK